MNVPSFDKLMLEQIEGAKQNSKLLLHCCCAPCSTVAIERLKDYFDLSVFFYNPNIEDGEYEKRKAELIRFIGEAGGVKIVDCDHQQDKFFKAVKGFEDCPEGGERCKICYRLRLEETARAADLGGFDYFSTTLTLSPLKDSKVINSIGESIACRAQWLYSDFKKRNGYLRSLELSKEHSLYRQNYCGCAFSRAQRVEKDAKK